MSRPRVWTTDRPWQKAPHDHRRPHLESKGEGELARERDVWAKDSSEQAQAIGQMLLARRRCGCRCRLSWWIWSVVAWLALLAAVIATAWPGAMLDIEREGR